MYLINMLNKINQSLDMSKLKELIIINKNQIEILGDE